MEEKVVTLKFENGKLKVTVDPNKDGQTVCEVMVDLSEVADEILAYFKK